jgi:CDP-glycerol glycerophosphotransferase (TagB/SpsB family)
LLSAGGGDFFCEFSLIKAFALNKIESLEIQHGIISYDNPTYITPKDEFYNIAVYGPYYKKILIDNGGYSSSNVSITGQPRYDILSKSKIGKKRICDMLCIDFNKKLVIWTTQTHSLSLDEAVRTKSTIYKTFKSLKNIQLVIKIHPGETNLNFYNDDLFHPILVKEEINAFELAYACDLMITKDSTTALEAIAMNKPVIIFNLSGEPDFVNYVEEGVAIGVYSEEKLKHSLVYLLKDDSILEENRKSFIENYLYRLDGKSTKRVIKLVNELNK